MDLVESVKSIERVVVSEPSLADPEAYTDLWMLFVKGRERVREREGKEKGEMRVLTPMWFTGGGRERERDEKWAVWGGRMQIERIENGILLTKTLIGTPRTADRKGRGRTRERTGTGGQLSFKDVEEKVAVSWAALNRMSGYL